MQAQVFDLFFSTKLAGRGIGLAALVIGLARCLVAAAPAETMFLDAAAKERAVRSALADAEQTPAAVTKAARTVIADFQALVRRYRKDLLAYCGRLQPRSGSAEDALQQTLLQAYIRLDQLRSAELFRPWLLRIAVNEMRKFRRQNRYDYLLSSID